MNPFNPPTYVYCIHNEQLGLFYIGLHLGQHDDPDDRYMGSSPYLDAVRKEFKEYPFTKHLIRQFDTETEAKALETELILEHRTTSGLLNRSANNGMDQWEPQGYGSITDVLLKSRLDRARKVVRPLELKTGDHTCIIYIKRPDGTAHAACNPSRDLTPKPEYGNWTTQMLDTYNSLPAGNHHFATIVSVRQGYDGRTKINYKPYAYVESFETEQEARTAGSLLVYLQSAAYQAAVSST